MATSSVHVALLSGRSADVPFSADLSIGRLKVLAEAELGVEIASLCKEGSVTEMDLQAKAGDAGLQAGDILYATVGQPRLYSARHYPGFILIRADGKAQSFGAPQCQIGFQAVQDSLRDVLDICFTTAATAALLSDGRVVVWGARDVGGCGPPSLTNVQQISSTYGAFSAVLHDGGVVAWGNADDGGDCQEVQEQLRGVDRLYSSGQSFAAVRKDGSVVTWGDSSGGGSGDSSGVREKLQYPVSMAGTCGAFAALLPDSGVVCWGDPDFGGDCTRVQHQLWNVMALYSNDLAFAALRSDGHVVTWGRDGVASVKALPQQVVDIQASNSAFAALLADGTVAAWGCKRDGGDCRHVRDQLKDIRALCASSSSFGAVRQDGSVVTWGKLQMPPVCGDIHTLSGALGSFAVLLSDGQVLSCTHSKTRQWVPVEF